MIFDLVSMNRFCHPSSMRWWWREWKWWSEEHFKDLSSNEIFPTIDLAAAGTLKTRSQYLKFLMGSTISSSSSSWNIKFLQIFKTLLVRLFHLLQPSLMIIGSTKNIKFQNICCWIVCVWQLGISNSNRNLKCLKFSAASVVGLLKVLQLFGLPRLTGFVCFCKLTTYLEEQYLGKPEKNPF